jgi:hypothetical protein
MSFVEAEAQLHLGDEGRFSFPKLEGAACANFIASAREVFPDSFSAASIII